MFYCAAIIIKVNGAIEFVEINWRMKLMKQMKSDAGWPAQENSPTIQFHQSLMKIDWELNVLLFPRRAALQQLSSPPSIKQMSLLCLMRERRKSWLVELRGPLHWKSKIFKLRPPHPAVKPINSINWIMAGGPSSSTNTFNPFFPLGRKEWNWIVCCCWSGPFNLALQLLNKSISRCSIALLFNN